MTKPISAILFKANGTYSNNYDFSPFKQVPSTVNVHSISSSTDKSDKKLSTKQLIALCGTILVGAAMFTIGFVGKKKVSVIKNVNEKISKNEFDKLYRKNLAKGLSKLLGLKIESSSLKSVIGKEELLKILPTLKAENYQATPDNIKNCEFIADLHSHSIFSDGMGKVEDILSKVAEYADKLHRKSGKKFIFALTDHNEIRGIVKALEIIAQEPNKFKNVKFVPGMEISYALKVTNSNNPFEVAEVLSYGVNPFSDDVIAFVQNIHQKRQKMMINFLADLKMLYPNTTFSLEEMAKHYPTDKTCLMNLQWQVHHYAQTKIGITQLAKRQNTQPEILYQQIMDKCSKRTKTLYILKQQHLVPECINESYEVTKLAKEKYSTTLSNGIISVPTENSFEEIINTFSKEDSAFLAFAHPAYINKNMKNLKETLLTLENLTMKSKGLLKASKSYHQAYKYPLISQHEITEIQKHTNKMGLLNLGGQDSHSANWIL